MSRKIFVNLPVKDLDRSMQFFTALGFDFDPQFTDANATCMIISDFIFAMLLVEKFFATFTDKTIVDAHRQVEALICLELENQAEVNAMTEAAIQAGGQEPRPARNLGFMYQRSFQDLDGHIWELISMHGTPGQSA